MEQRRLGRGRSDLGPRGRAREETWSALSRARPVTRACARAPEQPGSRLGGGDEGARERSGRSRPCGHVREGARRFPVRSGRAAGAGARACLPAHVGVIFKWNVGLEARPGGGRVGCSSWPGGRCGSFAIALGAS